jgi:tRNA(Arg) A34 adenosine deaminase TadA/CheY-like chemotaxis protein
MTGEAKAQILVVEPNDVMRKLICGIVMKNGYAALEAVSGDNAVALLAKQPDLVILDVDGASTDDMGFLRKMQRDHLKMPLIALSDQADQAEIEKRLSMPRLSFVGKPVKPDLLMMSIEAHLAVDAEQRQAEEARKNPAQAEVEEQRKAFMRRAIDLSQQKMDENCGGPFGAVIVRQGKIIGEGWNCVTSTNDPTAHAEMVAIRNATAAIKDFKLEGCDIYTSCEPCPMCLSAIYWARLDRIFYANMREDAERIGFDDAFLYREVALPENKRSLPVYRLLREEAKIVFDNWTRKQDKTDY